jgi:exopolyphosphatase/guanosine-5'-triphosphate,3'-diphosphate pyrophosphatase
MLRRACIDIGSNTTRLLVADRAAERLIEVHQERAFTHIGRGLGADGAITAAKIAEVSRVVSAQLRAARGLGAADVRAVATAAIRRARNGGELAVEIHRACGLDVLILSAEEEARLAFVGAARTLGHTPSGPLGVIDVGGGSCELVVGTFPDRVEWCASRGIGSGDLAASCLRSDPPTQGELSAVRARVARELQGLEVPHPVEAVAVGGSATSLRTLAGPLLDSQAFARSLAVLAQERTTSVARRFGLDVERVRLLPAGLLILQRAQELFGVNLQVGLGGVREGVLLEAGDQ